MGNAEYMGMKLIAISALAGFAAAEQMLAGMHADSDECAGCEVAPEPVFKCFGEAFPMSSAVTWLPSPLRRATPPLPSSALCQRATTPTPTTAEATASAVAPTPSTPLATESRLSTRCAQRVPSTGRLQWI